MKINETVFSAGGVSFSEFTVVLKQVRYGITILYFSALLGSG